MICFYTRAKVNENFNKNILLKMFFQWLDQKDKNRMNGLDYNGEDSYQYSINKKTLKIEDFKDNKTFGIQFIMEDPYRKSCFKVEVIYLYEEYILDFVFHKEINEESQFVGAISIPGIFKDLLLSGYIEEDDQLRIQEKPFFIGQREYKALKNKKHYLPLVVLYRNQKCCVDPIKLNKEVFGIGHVICVHTKSQQQIAKIIYPDGFIETLEQRKEFLMIKEIREKLRIYMIQENNEYYTFDELLNLKLHKEHHHKKEENKEYKQYFIKEIQKLKEDIEELKQEYTDKQLEYQKIKEENEMINTKLSLDYQNALIILKDENYEEYQKILIDVLKKKVNDLPLEDNFRKRDIINDILRSQK